VYVYTRIKHTFHDATHKNHMRFANAHGLTFPAPTCTNPARQPLPPLSPHTHGADPVGTSLQRVPSTNTSGRAGFNGFHGHGGGGVHTPGSPYRDGSHLSFKKGWGSSGAGGGIVAAGERELGGELLDRVRPRGGGGGCKE
jgi:hypothetical protein